tara:strand:+ start:154 stop:582 length:429 start_codon:yes stop_codon:yes gene_type:complete
MFFNREKNDNKKDNLTKIAALLIHAAKIDQNFSPLEEDIIKQTMMKLGSKEENVEQLMLVAKKIEQDSNQILDFTKKVKNMNEADKVQIIEALWKIIYSNNDADIYETNLMRRLGGLLYIDDRIIGDIKNKIKNKVLNDLSS